MPELGESLSERELDVLKCLSKGAGNKEIAGELHISQNTVKVHLRNIYTKLGASSRTEATAVALQQGLISLPGMEVTEPDSESVEAPAETESDTTVEIAPEENIHWLNRRPLAIFLGILSFLLLILLISVFSNWQRATAVPQITPEPYEPETVAENWKALRPLPEPRSNMAAAAVGLNVYLIGGETESGVDNSVMIYHTTDHIWQEAAEKLTAVTNTSAAELFGEIYMPGGQLADGEPTEIVEAYSPTNDSWREITPLPQPVAGGLTLSDGSFLYLIGGWNGREYLDTVYIYDPGAGNWDELPNMNQPRANLMGGIVTGDLYVVGGTDGEEALATCEFFDLTEGIWNDCPDMLMARFDGGAVSIVNKLYVLGGHPVEDPAMFGEFYSPENGIWQLTEPVEFFANKDLTSQGVTNVETGIFVIGGQNENDGERMADSYIYSPLVYQTYLPAAPASGE